MPAQLRPIPCLLHQACEPKLNYKGMSAHVAQLQAIILYDRALPRKSHPVKLAYRHDHAFLRKLLTRYRAHNSLCISVLSHGIWTR